LFTRTHGLTAKKPPNLPKADAREFCAAIVASGVVSSGAFRVLRPNKALPSASHPAHPVHGAPASGQAARAGTRQSGVYRGLASGIERAMQYKAAFDAVTEHSLERNELVRLRSELIRRVRQKKVDPVLAIATTTLCAV